ncbi:MFS general substrate transporter [Rhizodiscina lignyota]|uniref:MFS general substrate transporter n=1 Tax=Rhizodiscina lignyota TaxID=1504668 RepID=A0A9P4IE44_9PEZI|nr:MFS general substrate transporter [Rhizodiscina lignyota]
MGLTPDQRLPRDPNKFPAAQLGILALVRVAEPIALTSFLPYAWKAVLHYEIGDKSDAAFYAGVLIAAFAFAEALTGIYWGSVSDRVGRKPVLLFGCAGTLLSLLVVGFASNFWVALFGRLLGGMLNGNVGVIQTMVGELTVNPAHEPKAFAVMPAVWSIGTILGPAVGGLFADPAENFPSLFSRDGLFGTFPYLLPNVMCAVLMFVSIIAGYFFLDETHPDMQPWSTQEELDNTTAETPLLPTTSNTTTAAADLTTESYGTFNPVRITEDSPSPRPEKRHKSSDSSSISSASSSKCYNKSVLILIVALGLYTYHSMTYDTLMPIYLQDDADESPFAGGLDLSMQQTGVIMSINGVVALFIQAFIFPYLATKIGVWRLFAMVTIGHPICYFIVPFLGCLPPQWLYFGIYTCLTIRNFFMIIAYPLLLILIKEAAPSPCTLGKINGLAASTGGACRMMASPVSGFLYSVGTNAHFSPVPWWSSAVVAIIGALQIPFIKRQKNKTAHIGNAVAWTAANDNAAESTEEDKTDILALIQELEASEIEQV